VFDAKHLVEATWKAQFPCSVLFTSLRWERKKESEAARLLWILWKELVIMFISVKILSDPFYFYYMLDVWMEMTCDVMMSRFAWLDILDGT